MLKIIASAMSLFMCCSVYCQENILLLTPTVIPLLPETSIDNQLRVNYIFDNESKLQNTNIDNDKKQLDSEQVILNKNIEVVLVPKEDIKTSYSRASENNSIFLIRRAINLTQLQSKGEDKFVPITNSQVIEQIQNFVTQKSKKILATCNIEAEIKPEKHGDFDTESSVDKNYLYRINLGLSRLVINKTLMSASLSGEGEAIIIENNLVKKRLIVGSHNGSNISLEKFDQKDIESDIELIATTSKVVDIISDRLGEKLCEFFY